MCVSHKLLWSILYAQKFIIIKKKKAKSVQKRRHFGVGRNLTQKVNTFSHKCIHILLTCNGFNSTLRIYDIINKIKKNYDH